MRVNTDPEFAENGVHFSAVDEEVSNIFLGGGSDPFLFSGSSSILRFGVQLSSGVACMIIGTMKIAVPMELLEAVRWCLQRTITHSTDSLSAEHSNRGNHFSLTQLPRKLPNGVQAIEWLVKVGVLRVRRATL